MPTVVVINTFIADFIFFFLSFNKLNFIHLLEFIKDFQEDLIFTI